MQQTGQQKRGYWVRTLHQWHWISSALCLVGMLMFAATGITLNHAQSITSTPRIVAGETTLPAAMLQSLNGKEHLPLSVQSWLRDHTGQDLSAAKAEWTEDEVYLSAARAGGDRWLSIDRATGAIAYEDTDRGTIAYLNDLHKGRNTGAAWNVFIDVFSIACLVFCISGFFLLYFHARQRNLTWPLVAAGLVIPLLLALLFIH